MNLDLGPEGATRCLDTLGLTFMFAPRYHPAMAKVRSVRKALGIKTAFNFLGPLLNPADAQYGLVGVWSPDILELMGDAVKAGGMKRALVVHSMGLDELSPLGPADVVEIRGGNVERYTADPKDVGIPRCVVEDLKGGDAQLNRHLLMDVFEGKPGPIADALVLNAGYALAASGVADTP